MYASRSFHDDAVSHYTFYERRPRKNENNIENCFYICLRLHCRPAIPKLCAAAPRNISKYCFFLLFVYYSVKLLGQVVSELFGPNYLIRGSVRYYFWPMGAVTNC